MPPLIDRATCIGCGACVFVCGKFIFDFDGRKQLPLTTRADQCVNCFMCEDACPVAAIRIKVTK